MADQDELARAIEVMLDVILPMLDGKDDDDLVFLDGYMRGLAEQLGIDATFPEVEPMPAGVLRQRWRESKERLAHDPPTAASEASS